MESVNTFFKEENDPFYQRGFRKGLELAREEIMRKETERWERAVVRNLLLMELGLSDERIVDVLGVRIELVQEIRASLEGE